MWEKIKNDPILKYVTIIVLSVLGFGFAYNVMFGSRNNGMMNEMNIGGGPTLESSLSYIITIGVKLLLIGVLIAAVITVIRFILKTKNQGGEINMEGNGKNDSILKVVIIALIAIVGLGLVLPLFSGLLGNGMYGMNYNGMNNMMGSQTYGFSLTSILGFLLKLLFYVSIIGTAVGIFMFIKQQYFDQNERASIIKSSSKIINCPKCSAKVSEGFKFCPECGELLKQKCATCGAELKTEWKCCPSCGAEKT